MAGFPIFDYAPSTLVGIFVLLVFFGALVPYRVVKAKEAENAYLRSALEKAQAALLEEQETGKVVRHFIGGLSRGIDQ